MLKYLKRMLQGVTSVAVGVGGGCGLLVFIAMLIFKGESKSFQFSLTAGFIIGTLAAIFYLVISTLLDLTARLFLARGMAEGIWEVEQTRDLIVDGTIKEVVAACRQALLAVPYIKAVSDDIENLITRASTGASWRSPGEEMEVEINPLEENKWKLRCTSRPKSKAIVFDYGKNFANVETWRREFENIIKQKQKANAV